MPRKRTIAPRSCKVLWEGVTPAGDASPDLFALPASFPSHVLDEDQMQEVTEWWDSFAADLLHTLKRALVVAPKKNAREEVKPTAQAFVVRALVLAHLLRLHPACEVELKKLAAELKLPKRQFFYAQEAILETLAPDAVRAFHAARQERGAAIEYLASHRDLDYRAAQRVSSRALLIPFVRELPFAARFAIMKDVGKLPGVHSVSSAPIDGHPALKVTLKP